MVLIHGIGTSITMIIMLMHSLLSVIRYGIIGALIPLAMVGILLIMLRIIGVTPIIADGMADTEDGVAHTVHGTVVAAIEGIILFIQIVHILIDILMGRVEAENLVVV